MVFPWCFHKLTFLLMTSAKIHISSSSHTQEELSSILSNYTTSPICSYKQLFGGYSGASYLIELDTPPDGPTTCYVMDTPTTMPNSCVEWSATSLPLYIAIAASLCPN